MAYSAPIVSVPIDITVSVPCEVHVHASDVSLIVHRPATEVAAKWVFPMPPTSIYAAVLGWPQRGNEDSIQLFVFTLHSVGVGGDAALRCDVFRIVPRSYSLIHLGACVVPQKVAPKCVGVHPTRPSFVVIHSTGAVRRYDVIVQEAGDVSVGGGEAATTPANPPVLLAHLDPQDTNLGSAVQQRGTPLGADAPRTSVALEWYNPDYIAITYYSRKSKGLVVGVWDTVYGTQHRSQVVVPVPPQHSACIVHLGSQVNEDGLLQIRIEGEGDQVEATAHVPTQICTLAAVCTAAEVRHAQGEAKGGTTEDKRPQPVEIDVWGAVEKKVNAETKVVLEKLVETARGSAQRVADTLTKLSTRKDARSPAWIKVMDDTVEVIAKSFELERHLRTLSEDCLKAFFAYARHRAADYIGGITITPTKGAVETTQSTDGANKLKSLMIAVSRVVNAHALELMVSKHDLMGELTELFGLLRSYSAFCSELLPLKGHVSGLIGQSAIQLHSHHTQDRNYPTPNGGTVVKRTHIAEAQDVTPMPLPPRGQPLEATYRVRVCSFGGGKGKKRNDNTNTAPVGNGTSAAHATKAEETAEGKGAVKREEKKIVKKEENNGGKNERKRKQESTTEVAHKREETVKTPKTKRQKK